MIVDHDQTYRASQLNFVPFHASNQADRPARPARKSTPPPATKMARLAAAAGLFSVARATTYPSHRTVQRCPSDNISESPCRSSHFFFEMSRYFNFITEDILRAKMFERMEDEDHANYIADSSSYKNGYDFQYPQDQDATSKMISLRSFTVLLEQRGIIPRVLTAKQVERI